MSQFLILIHDDESWMTDPQVGTKLMEGHAAFQSAAGDRLLGGHALESVTTATTIRPDGADGFTVTDGPFIESKEVLGGYYLVEAADLDEAIALAKQVPVNSGGLEVRPIHVMG